ncbi:MAG: lytic transglycosylase domain-containing protein [Chlorobi bacterium]|nr:lytic transglycosylase domain-containing protein [Chlorobiota bacterium]
MKIKNLFWTLWIVGGGWALFTLWAGASEGPRSAEPDPDPSEDVRRLLREHYRIYAVPLPDSLDFAGEPVPLRYPYVRERLDKELLINVYWQSNTLLYIKRAAKYFPVIEPLLDSAGIPDDFKFVALAESGLQHVKSPAGARGIWQLMPETARKYGLIVNKDIDERYHLEKSTRAAARYLKNAKEKFGTWTLAAAAYNRGMQGLEKALTDQKETDYYKLYLNPETARYIYRIVALKEILRDPSAYGFHVREEDLYAIPPHKTVRVTGRPLDWVAIAKAHGISYGELRYMNPWIRSYAYPNKAGDTFEVKIPIFE